MYIIQVVNDNHQVVGWKTPNVPVEILPTEDIQQVVGERFRLRIQPLKRQEGSLACHERRELLATGAGWAPLYCATW